MVYFCNLHFPFGISISIAIWLSSFLSSSPLLSFFFLRILLPSPSLFSSSFSVSHLPKPQFQVSKCKIRLVGFWFLFSTQVTNPSQSGFYFHRPLAMVMTNIATTQPHFVFMYIPILKCPSNHNPTISIIIHIHIHRTRPTP